MALGTREKLLASQNAVELRLRAFFADRSAATFTIVLAACTAAFVIFALVYFGRIFVLIEYRQWAIPPHIAMPFDIARGRALGIFTAAALANVCGYSPACHDVFQIAFLVATGVLLATALRRLFPEAPWVLAVGAAVFFWFTEPMLDALVWQATVLDKLAVFFTALGIWMAARLDVRRNGVPSLIAHNVLMLFVVFCAYNSKEASWPLVPSLVALLALRYFDAEPASSFAHAMRAVRLSVVSLAAPILYGVYHVARVLANIAAAGAAQNEHNTGGNAVLNAYYYLLYMSNAHPLAQALNEYPYAPPPDKVKFLSACVLVAVVVAALIAWRAPARLTRWWAWSALSFLVAFAIPLRTQYSSPFYLLVPSYYLSIVLFLTVAVAVAVFPGRGAVRLMLGAAAVALALHLIGFVQTMPPYAYVETMSANFDATLDALRSQLERTPRPSHIAIYEPKTELSAYRFVQPPGPTRNLAQYVLPRGTSFTDYDALNAVITDETYDGPEPHPTPAPGTISIVLGDGLRLSQFVAPSR